MAPFSVANSRTIRKKVWGSWKRATETSISVGAGLSSGYFQNDKKNGLGQLTYKAGQKVFKGYWSRNLRHGNGVVIDRETRAEFHGSFKDDKKEGFGLLIEKVRRLTAGRAEQAPHLPPKRAEK